MWVTTKAANEFYTYCGTALAQSILTLSIVPVAAPITVGGCAIMGAVALMGTFMTAQASDNIWNWGGGTSTVTNSGSSIARQLQELPYDGSFTDTMNGLFADIGFVYNDTHTQSSYQNYLDGLLDSNIVGRFVMSKEVTDYNVTSAYAHLVFTNHTTHQSVAIVPDGVLGKALGNLQSRESCGDQPCEGGATLEWMSYNVYGWNGADQWDGNGIKDTMGDLGSSSSYELQYLNDNDIESVGKFCAAASLPGNRPGVDSIIVGEVYLEAYGGIDSQCDSWWFYWSFGLPINSQMTMKRAESTGQLARMEKRGQMLQKKAKTKKKLKRTKEKRQVI
jgi:hypothetical protein